MEVKTVEEVFENHALLWHVRVGARVIRTTDEHPFYVRGKGWTAARELEPGHLLRSHDGQWLPVREVYDSGETEKVYNLRIADYHTYFVGSREWGFSVWAHNACQITLNRLNGNAFRDFIAATLQQAGYVVKTEKYFWTPLGKRYIDIVVMQGGKIVGGIETKVGSSPYTALQQLKDLYIKATQGWGVTVVRK